MKIKVFILAATLSIAFLVLPNYSKAATLSVSPATGVYTAGATFSARVIVNTTGQSINAAEGTLTFNPQELTVVAVDRAGSIFNLWVTEPTFSNTAGTISFSGGMPTGYTGASGSIFNVTFRTKTANTARVSLTGGSVLANDGRGTNVLTSMGGGTYTIQAPSTSPTPEVIEYVAPANTPAAPRVTSNTHSDTDTWYIRKSASLSWDLPPGITAVRTALDKSPNSIPTKLYDNPIKNIELNDLPESISYFHIQFKNEDGWGRVTHFKIAIDSEKPTSFEISSPENADLANPIQTLSLKTEDVTSGVIRYMIRVDNHEPYEYIDVEETGLISLKPLTPGYHTVIIEAFDRAGNSIIQNFSFTTTAFSNPEFTEYPNEINEDVIPVIRGNTRANATVEVTVTRIGAEPTIYNLVADETGVFTLIPEGTFSSGVYELVAKATDEFGAISELSNPIRIAVQQPGFIRVGSMIVSVLSVIIPLAAMVLLLVVASWFLLLYFRRFKRKISVESSEVATILDKEFTILFETLVTQRALLEESRKTKKLTKAEEGLFAILDSSLKQAQKKVEKEVADVERLVQKKE
jgi:hypothetical protein